MEPEALLPCSQPPITRPCLELDELCPHLHTLFLLKSVLILCLHLYLGLFPSGSPTEIIYSFIISPVCATCPSHLYLITLITFGEKYKYTVLFVFLLLPST